MARRGLRLGSRLLREHGGLSQSTHKAAKLPLWSAELDAYFADPAALFEAPDGLAKLGAAALLKATKKNFEAPQSAAGRGPG